MGIDEVTKEWFNSKNKDSNDNGLYHNSYDDYYLYLDKEEDEVIYFFKNNVEVEDNIIATLLDLVNKYFYYLKRNTTRALPKLQENKKKLNNLIKLLDNDFMNYLHEYIDFDETLAISKDSIKIIKSGSIKGYLDDDFRCALQRLKEFNDSNQTAKNALSITQRTKCLFLKPDTTAYKQELSKKAILKGLHFELLYYFKSTKQQSIDIISYFFDEILQEKKVEHTFSKKLIDLLCNHTKEELMDEYNKHQCDERCPKHIQEITNIFNLFDALK